MYKKIAFLSIGIFFLFSIVALPLTADVTYAQSCKSKKMVKVKKDACQTSCKTSCSTASSACCPGDRNAAATKRAAMIKKMSAKLPYHEAKRVVVEGKYVCGKCSFEELDTCQGFIKTSKGNLIPLIKNGKLRGMCNVVKNDSDNQYEVVGRVKIVNGIKFLNVTKVAKL